MNSNLKEILETPSMESMAFKIDIGQTPRFICSLFGWQLNCKSECVSLMVGHNKGRTNSLCSQTLLYQLQKQKKLAFSLDKFMVGSTVFALQNFTWQAGWNSVQFTLFEMRTKDPARLNKDDAMICYRDKVMDTSRSVSSESRCPLLFSLRRLRCHP